LNASIGAGRPCTPSVVLNKARDGFITVTADNGTVKSVSGQDVTITEAAGSVTYKDVTLTVPEKATVYRNGSAAKLGDLRTGDRGPGTGLAVQRGNHGLRRERSAPARRSRRVPPRPP